MFSTPRTLQVKRYSEGDLDARGNASAVYANPVDWPVHQIVPGAGRAMSGGLVSHEPLEASPDIALVEYTILAPDNDLLPGRRDQVVFDGDDYEVNGHPTRWSQAGPWAFAAAPAVVRIRRTED